MDKIPITILLFLLVIFLPTNDFVIEKWEIQNNQTELLAQSPILATEKDRIEQKLSVIQVEVEEVKLAIRDIWGKKAEQAIKLSYCESRHDLSAVNYDDALITGMPSWGLFQINAKKFDGWDNAWYNTKIAKEMYDKRGFTPWKNCSKALGLL